MRDWLTIKEAFPNFHAGDRIIGLRYREDMTQKRLAEEVGISVQNRSHKKSFFPGREQKPSS